MTKITLERDSPAIIDIPIIQGNSKTITFVMEFRDEFDALIPLDLRTFNSIKMCIRDSININTVPLATFIVGDGFVITGASFNGLNFTLSQEFVASQTKTWYYDILFVDGLWAKTLYKGTIYSDLINTAQ